MATTKKFSKFLTYFIGFYIVVHTKQMQLLKKVKIINKARKATTRNKKSKK